jgi:hypothetical protein
VVRVHVLLLQMTVVHPSVSTDRSFLHTRAGAVWGWGGRNVLCGWVAGGSGAHDFERYMGTHNHRPAQKSLWCSPAFQQTAASCAHTGRHGTMLECLQAHGEEHLRKIAVRSVLPC